MSSPRRRGSRPVAVGDVVIGGGAPIVVQSMTNTDTADAEATARQVMELAGAGLELVRITVNTPEAAAQVAPIRGRLDALGCDVPLIGDFHFNGHKLLTQYPDCAKALAKYRINPGNVGKGAKRDDQFATMIEAALQHGKPVRMGVNGGSLDPGLLARMTDENGRRAEPHDADDVMREAMIVSGLESAAQAEKLGLPAERIVISCKLSGVQDLILVYRELARRCRYALHLGLTEAGMGSKGIVASSAAMAVLLQEGIGDTIRVSLTPEPGGDRTREVLVAQELLQTMGLRSFTPLVAACPGCGRTTSTYFQELAQRIQDYLRTQMPAWKARYPGVEEMKVAVMGCLPLETPSAERREVLTSKGGVEKEIYALTRLADAEDDEAASKGALRFDLTVPLARYVAMRERELAFPFRRYQIQRVWRGETPQANKGRFREFYQCDIDIIGREKLSYLAEAEIPSVIYSVFKEMAIGEFRIRINNRKVLRGLLEMYAVPEKAAADVLRVLDKMEKIGPSEVLDQLTDLGVTTDEGRDLIRHMSEKRSTDETLKELAGLRGAKSDAYGEGVKQLTDVVAGIRAFGVPDSAFAVDLRVVRGLDYYTGTTYETTLTTAPELGSICSGGRN